MTALGDRRRPVKTILDRGKEGVHMGNDLFFVLIALLISAVFKTDLLWTVAVTDLIYRLYRLLRFVYIKTRRRRNRRSPSSSDKRDGRLRNSN